MSTNSPTFLHSVSSSNEKLEQEFSRLLLCVQKIKDSSDSGQKNDLLLSLASVQKLIETKFKDGSGNELSVILAQFNRVISDIANGQNFSIMPNEIFTAIDILRLDISKTDTIHDLLEGVSNDASLALRA